MSESFYPMDPDESFVMEQESFFPEEQQESFFQEQESFTMEEPSPQENPLLNLSLPSHDVYKQRSFLDKMDDGFWKDIMQDMDPSKQGVFQKVLNAGMPPIVQSVAGAALSKLLVPFGLKAAGTGLGGCRQIHACHVRYERGGHRSIHTPRYADRRSNEARRN